MTDRTDPRLTGMIEHLGRLDDDRLARVRQLIVELLEEQDAELPQLKVVD